MCSFALRFADMVLYTSEVDQVKAKIAFNCTPAVDNAAFDFSDKRTHTLELTTSSFGAGLLKRALAQRYTVSTAIPLARLVAKLLFSSRL